MKRLECSTHGDHRFSSLCARIELNNEYKSIEEWYQFSKKFINKNPSSIKEIKRLQHRGINPHSFIYNNIEFNIKYLSEFYILLWVYYLGENPNLAFYASGFDEFNDYFRNENTINCQADVIRDYIKLGRRFCIEKCKDFIEILKEENENDDLLKIL